MLLHHIQSVYWMSQVWGWSLPAFWTVSCCVFRFWSLRTSSRTRIGSESAKRFTTCTSCVNSSHRHMSVASWSHSLYHMCLLSNLPNYLHLITACLTCIILCCRLVFNLVTKLCISLAIAWLRIYACTDLWSWNLFSTPNTMTYHQHFSTTSQISPIMTCIYHRDLLSCGFLFQVLSDRPYCGGHCSYACVWL